MFVDCSLLELLSDAKDRYSLPLIVLLTDQLKLVTERVQNAIFIYENETNAVTAVRERVLSFISECRKVVIYIETLCEEVDNSVLSSLKEVLEEVTLKCESLQILAPFTSLVNRITLIDGLITESVNCSKQNKYLTSVHHLCKAKQETATLRSLPLEPSLADDVYSLLTAIELDASFLWESLAVTCKQFWKKSIRLKSEFDCEKGKLVFLMTIEFGDDISQADDYLHSLDEMLLLRALVCELGDSLVQNILEPYSKHEIDSVEVSDAGVSVSYSRRSGSKSISTLHFVQKVELIIYYVTVAFSKLKSNLFCKYFRSKSEEILQWIINKLILPAIPTNQAQIPDYQLLMDTVSNFENSLIVNGYLSSKSEKLEQLSKNVKSHFASKVFQQVLVKGRELIKGSFYPTVDVGCLNDSHCIDCKHELDECFPCFKQCKVSESIIKLKELLRETFSEFSSDTKEFRVNLSTCIRNICELYITTFPCIHRSELLNDQKKVALFYNNSMFLAHELLSLEYDYEDQISDTLYKELLSSLKQLGTDYLVECLRKQRNLIFFDLHDASRKLILSS